MNQHIYLRAYMAGIVVPTIFLLIVATVFTIARYIHNVPVPVERVIVFPMAVVPNAWGLWNLLFVALCSRRQLSIGLWGALLPLLLAPLAIHPRIRSRGFASCRPNHDTGETSDGRH